MSSRRLYRMIGRSSGMTAMRFRVTVAQANLIDDLAHRHKVAPNAITRACVDYILAHPRQDLGARLRPTVHAGTSCTLTERGFLHDTARAHGTTISDLMRACLDAVAAGEIELDPHITYPKRKGEQSPAL